MSAGSVLDRALRPILYGAGLTIGFFIVCAIVELLLHFNPFTA